MKVSLSTINDQCEVPAASINGAPASAIGIATIARLTMKLLRTIAGTVSVVSSGSIRNAPAMRGSVSARASIGFVPKSISVGRGRGNR